MSVVRSIAAGRYRTITELVDEISANRNASLAWLGLLVAVVVIASLTSLERIRVGGLNLRVMSYFAVGALVIARAALVAVRLRRLPTWMTLMGALVGWFTLTAIIAHQTPVEWLPTLVRFALYFGAAVVAYDFGRRIEVAEDRRLVARASLLVVVSAAIFPAIMGVAEVARGSAAIVNGAPRISGSMPGHFVAYSLLLAVATVACIALSFTTERWGLRALAWLAAGLLTAVIFATFTRLTVIVVVVAFAAIAFLLPGPWRRRLRWTGAALAVGLVVAFLAQPLFDARFVYTSPISKVLAPSAAPTATHATPAPSSTNRPTATASPKHGGSLASDGGFDVEVDESIAYRIMLHQHGIAYVLESPLVGHGPGSFDRLFQAETGQADVAAHDDFLSVAVETGIPGLLLYLLLLGSLARALWPRVSTADQSVDTLVVAALTLLGGINVGAVIHNPTYFVEIQLPIWLLVGTAMGLKSSSRAMGVASRREGAS